MGLFNNNKQMRQHMSFEEKCAVLGEFWLNYREDAEQNEAWSEFFNLNDIGLPLSFTLAEGLVSGATAEAVTFVEQTWELFCEYLDLDSDEFYESLSAMLNDSPRPPLDHKESKPAGRQNNLNDHGLEGFMGGRDVEIQVEPTTKYGIQGFLGRKTTDGGSHYGDERAAATNREPEITVTNFAWREIGALCLANGMRRAQVRLHFLPCQCGGRHWGLNRESHLRSDDVIVSNGSVKLILDPVSAKNARRTELDAEVNGSFTFSMSDSKFCSCGENWRPTLAVAAMAVTFGVVARNVAIANGWLPGNGAQVESSASNGDDFSDSGGGDYGADFNLDFGGF